MPQLKSLTVKDGQATPANVIFTPWDIDRNGVAHLRNSNGVPLGDKNFTLALRRNDTKFKGRMLLVVPVVVTETINGVQVPRVARTAFVDVNVTFDQTSTMQERKDAMSMMGNALLGSDTLISQSFYDLEGIY